MPKKSNSKKVAVIFNLPVELRDELHRKIPSGFRSQFIEKLLEHEFRRVKKSENFAPKKNWFARILKK